MKDINIEEQKFDDLFLETEQEAMVLEDCGSMLTQKIDGPIDVARFQGPPDLADKETQPVGGRGGGRGS